MLLNHDLQYRFLIIAASRSGYQNLSTEIFSTSTIRASHLSFKVLTALLWPKKVLPCLRMMTRLLLRPQHYCIDLHFCAMLQYFWDRARTRIPFLPLATYKQNNSQCSHQQNKAMRKPVGHRVLSPRRGLMASLASVKRHLEAICL
jgi:hypothetical protein